ncbi:exodeoxyribonuclease VII large subunit [Variovorax sp. VNK109]|uniref:exodeoxyribonuclease VII large subunit n=1 Tax=Variovorax sp. VNK109 TaxID=3400919 RepID=UPI003C122E50
MLTPRSENPATTPRIWQVGALCRAVADALDARFNPVSVQGEITGFSRAASGHCYFSLKDESGQLRCAMFRRAASLMDVSPRDGELVQVRGRLAVYEPRGDLQLIVESMSRAGQGALFEQFLRLKAKLDEEGLFDAARKRPVPLAPRCIGIVTSLGAAALHDVVTALRRRAPHVQVVISPAQVQGAAAPAELVRALGNLYSRVEAGGPGAPDVILLVRGGGSIEDLWAFNDEQVARAIVRSPVPLISGVGHETDFTIADFCADLRAPTPTAAAELAAQPRDVWLGAVALMAQRLSDATGRVLDAQAQRLDQATRRLGRPSSLMARERLQLTHRAQRLRYGVLAQLGNKRNALQRMEPALPVALHDAVRRADDRLSRARIKLELLDPALVLRRGYAWLTDETGHPLTSAGQFQPGGHVTATLSDGEVALTVRKQD